MTVTIADLERQLVDNKRLIERREMAQRLANNRDFKKLILEEFCGTDCARYAQESADPALRAEDRADALSMAQASGHLKRYLSLVIRMSSTAERNITDLEETLEEMRQADAAGEAEGVE